ncbi:MAG TPA: nitronate monooxygenase [Burkholderiales bacterium]|nr:nitronate monooxygenase [Burkholderiales bacterium]
MRISELFGTELPIIQAPMAGAQAGAMAIAVSNAGALGSLPCALLTTDSMRTELEAIRAQTSKPFNVNFFCHTPPVPSAEREAAWQTALAPFYREYGIDPASIPSGQGRAPFSEDFADALEPYRPPVVSFHFGLPSKRLLGRVKGWGSKVLCTATTVDEARWLESQGVNGIIAQGVEAGGHRGMFLTGDLTTQVGTFSLVPQVLRAVKLPVIAAGGIADARGVATLLEMGAAGVQVGTAYLLCPEALTSAVQRAALKSEASRHTALTNVFTGRPSRGIVNRVMRELGIMNGAAPEFPLAAAAIAPLRAKAEAAGLGDFTPLWSGQNATGCREVPAAQLTLELAAEV